jgi:uncharacterized NAD(P)/FAD-binding protein YdhS
MNVAMMKHEIAPDLVSPAGAARRPVVVVGSGFSGTMVALHLATRLPQDQPILLCERARLACGPAYATPNACHLLNVRAANMSAFPRQPEHFQDWLTTACNCPEEVEHTDAGLFASRGLYGRYLFSLLQSAISGAPARVRLLQADVMDIVPEGGGYRLLTADGASHAAAAVVLAIGNLPAVGAETALHRTNPWAPGVTADLRPDLPVLIVGTGLTMVDLALELRNSGFRGPVIALSRRGLLPHRHAATRKWPTPGFSAAERASLPLLLARVRQEVRDAAAVGVDWRSVVDSLRPITATLWRGLAIAEQRRFLRHLRPFWDIHRHRLSAPVARRLDTMLRDGELTVRRGRILDIRCGEGGAEVCYRPRGAVTPERLTVQRVINATGLQSAENADSPLLRALSGRRLIRFDPLAMGLDVTDALQVMDGDGRPHTNFWALGPIVRGVFWECVAVPDIRAQAETVADRVVAFLAATS